MSTSPYDVKHLALRFAPSWCGAYNEGRIAEPLPADGWRYLYRLSLASCALWMRS